MPSAPRAERRWRRRAVLALAAAGLAALVGYPLCDLIFDCGCTWPMLGADAHCDIHHAGPPDCPVCTYPSVGAAFFVALMAGCAAVVWGTDALVSRLRRRPGAGA
jgi:hypothetical protein